MSSFCLLLICGFLAIVSARFEKGKCPKVEPLDSFDLKESFGTWYVVASTIVVPDKAQKCSKLTFAGADGTRVTTESILKYKEGDKKFIFTGHALKSGEQRPAIISILFDRVDGEYQMDFPDLIPVNLTILETKPGEYFVGYTCIDVILFGEFHIEYLWVFSKTPKMEEATLKGIYDRLDKRGISRNELGRENQSCYVKGSNFE